jgi:hypothetical protein
MLEVKLILRRLCSRAAVFTLVAGLAASLLVTAPVSASTSSPFWNCPFGGPQPPLDPSSIYYVDVYTLVSATPTFLVADSRIVVNTLDTPISATFTSSQSRTFTITASIGSTIRLGETLTATIGSSITLSKTTQVGVSTTATVAPRSSLLGEYGAAGFNVVYDINVYKVTARVFCSLDRSTRGTGTAPTTTEGWRVRTV